MHYASTSSFVIHMNDVIISARKLVSNIFLRNIVTRDGLVLFRFSA